MIRHLSHLHTPHVLGCSRMGVIRPGTGQELECPQACWSCSLGMERLSFLHSLRLVVLQHYLLGEAVPNLPFLLGHTLSCAEVFTVHPLSSLQASRLRVWEFLVGRAGISFMWQRVG